jgi:hypothetical protein
MDLRAFVSNLRAFIAPFHDPRAWTLIALCAGIVFLIDPVMVKTVLVWVLQAGVFLGLAIIGSRFVFPQINLAEHVTRARQGNTASGLVVLTVGLIWLGIMLSLAIFGRA